jgi:hypothetical protein
VNKLPIKYLRALRARALAVTFLLCLTVGIAFAADFGVLASAEPEFNSASGEDDFSFTGSLRPWLSAAPSEKTQLYFSLKLSLDWEDKELQPFLVELDRTEFIWRPAEGIFLDLGRQYVKDRGELILSGLFDGVSGNMSLGRVRLGLGAFYTGLLYKETAEITMNAGDLEKYAAKLDYTDWDSYFASRRVLFMINGEVPDLSPRTSLAFTVLGQFDVNDAGNGDALHTQYLEIGYFFAPLETLRFSAAAVFGLAEEAGDTRLHFAASAGAEWEVPGALPDLFALRGRWSSGEVNDTAGAFIPVRSSAQGLVFTPKLSGLATVKGSYTARLRQTVSAEAGFTYFFRTDTETVSDPELDPLSDSRLLGGEASGTVTWAPDSALRFWIGGGAFFPQMGGACISGAETRWKLLAGAAVSF